MPVEWKCTKFEKSELEIQLIFENPAEVSMQEQLDILSVKFVQEQIFRTLKDLIVIEPDLIVYKEIPAQYTSHGQQVFIATTTKIIEGGGYAMIIGVIIG